VGSPGVEVARSGDSTAASALVDAVADVLGEGGGTLDRGLVDLGVLPDVVDGAVAGDLAHLGALSRAGAVGGVLLDVVLNEGVGGPSVDGDENRASSGLGGAREVDLAGGTLGPALADDEVTSVGELDRVTVVLGREVDVAGGLVVLVVVLALDDRGLVGELKVGEVSSGSREGADNGGKSENDGAEGNHFDCLKKLLVGEKNGSVGRCCRSECESCEVAWWFVKLRQAFLYILCNG
jgi:hypothetical protein